LRRNHPRVAPHLHARSRSRDAPVFSKLPAINRVLQLIVSFDANQLNFESAISGSTRIRLSIEVLRFSLFGSGPLSELPTIRKLSGRGSTRNAE